MGRMGWRRHPETARYCVVCPDEGLEYLPYAEWLPLAEAEAIVARILNPRTAKRGAA